MIAEIFATGDEIRTGALVDTNSSHIAQNLEQIGLKVTRHQCAGDDLSALTAVLQEIGSRADVAVVTGGLGPTEDDLTAQAAAAAAEVFCALDRAALGSIERFYGERRRAMPSSAQKQALLPRGAVCLCNPVGTAPGFRLRIDRCVFFFLPGVPVEMRRMLSEQVLPEIERLQGDRRGFNLQKTLSCYGLTESATGEALAGFGQRFPQIRLGFRAVFPQIQIKLYARGQDRHELEPMMAAASEWVAQKMGRRLISARGESMPACVGRLLNQKKATLAVAESCTGGLIAHQLTNVAGSSDYFLLSAVTYSNDAKIKVLGVAADTLAIYGAVHEETAKQMAHGVRQTIGATFGLATSGIAGPGGGSTDKPVGTVCIGLATPGALRGYRYHFSFGDRLMHKQIFSTQALDILRRELLHQLDGML